MQASEYQILALLTEHTPDFVRIEGESDEHNRMVARAIHGVLGMMSEVGEIADALKKHIIYKRALDTINLMEEQGDILWYQALFAAAIKHPLEEAMDKNIAKLKLRYPNDTFTLEAATKRDLDAERRALEK